MGGGGQPDHQGDGSRLPPEDHDVRFGAADRGRPRSAHQRVRHRRDRRHVTEEPRVGRTRAKVSIVGAGNVGHSAAQWLLSHRLADIVLVDVIEGMPQGKALDLSQAEPIEGVDVRITGTNGYDETAGSDIVVIVAGIARKPGMSREDLLATNAGIARGVTEQVTKRSPNAHLIVVTN